MLLELSLLLVTANSAPAVTVVQSVDLARYAGTWYEIARLPNRFQRDCTSDITATYTLRPDWRITALNECRKANGGLKSAQGRVRVADPKVPNTKLKVSFFWPFSGGYWILDRDPDYRWAVVGTPGRDLSLGSEPDTANWRIASSANSHPSRRAGRRLQKAEANTPCTFFHLQYSTHDSI